MNSGKVLATKTIIIINIKIVIILIIYYHHLAAPTILKMDRRRFQTIRGVLNLKGSLGSKMSLARHIVLVIELVCHLYFIKHCFNSLNSYTSNSLTCWP